MLFLFSFFLYLLFFKIKSESNSFCGSHLLPKIGQRQLVINSIIKSNQYNTKNTKRKLELEYTPLKIIIDNQYLLYQLQNKKVSEKQYTLIINALNTASSMITSLISVEKNNREIELNEELITQNCNLGKHHYKKDYLSPNKITSDSIIIYPRFHDFKQNGVNNILTSASFCALDDDIDTGTNRPLAGFIYIEKNITDLVMRKTNI